MRYLPLLLVLISGPLLASGDDITQINKDGDVITSIVGGDTRAYALSGGDMDINQCLATHSILFGLWQGTHINAMCVADGLDADGKHREAAMMRCSVGRFRKVYGDTDECIRVTEYRPPPLLPPPPQDQRAAKYLEAEEELHVGQQVEIESIESRLARIEAGNRAAARAAQQRRDYAKQTIERLENDPEK